MHTSKPELLGGYVLLVEDDAIFADELSQYLEEHGIRCVVAPTTADALAEIEAETPQGVVLDQFVGQTDTLIWLSRLRVRYSGAVMFLSANEEVTDRILGLEMGAADFVSKTIQPREILARIRSLVRRTSTKTSDSAPLRASTSPRPGQWYVDTERLELFRPDGALVHLTTAEFETLRFLDESRGTTVSRDDLMRAVLGRNFTPLDRSIDNVVSRLRKKLQAAGNSGRLIKAVRGNGYLFVGFPTETSAAS